MALCGVVTVLLTAVTLRGLRASQRADGRRAGARRDVPAPARVGRADAIRPLSGGARRRRARRARAPARPARLRAARRRRGREALSRPCSSRSRSATSGGGAAVARRSSASRSAPAVVALAFLPFLVVAPGRRRAQPRAAALAAAPDREPRLGALPRRPSPGRARRRDALGPRLAEPLRDGNRSDGGRAQPRPDRSARLDLAAAAGDERGARSLERRRPRRVRRAREGALAAVPDLARAGRSARRRASAGCARRRCSRSRSS